MENLPQPVDHEDGWIRLPTGKIPIGNKFHKIIHLTLGEYRFLMDGHFSWPEARQRCDSVGGFLAEFETFLEHTIVTRVIDHCR